MVFWIIVGLTVWILCVLFMLAILRGGHRIRGNGYEQKLYSRSRVNAQNIKHSIKKRSEEDCKNKKQSVSAHK